MISKTTAATAAYTQTVKNNGDKKETVEVKKSKELDKIESLKEQIKSGQYEINIDKTADAVLKELV